MNMIRKSVPYILIVSLALNLILLGFILGEKRVFIGGPKPPATFRYVIQSLPSDMRDNFIKSMKSEFSNAQRDANMDRLFGGVLVESLSNGQFDREKFETAFNNLEVIMLQVHRNMLNRLMNTFEEMTPEQRKEFSERLNRKIENSSN